MCVEVIVLLLYVDFFMIDTVVETLYMYGCGIRFGLVRCCICNNMDVNKYIKIN